MSGPLGFAIARTMEGADLTRAEAAAAMGVLMDGGATDAQAGAFLAALRVKGERPAELLGFLDAFRERCRRVRLDDPDAIDLCGTGGDGSGTINVSTIASFVVAGAGVTVAKHGNRSVSSRSGSADVLRELGVKIDLPPERMEACINEVGIGFLFAPLYHPAMKNVAPVRAQLGVRTCFNLLGPLANPAGVRRQVVGAFDPRAADTIAALLGAMSPASAAVVHSGDGLDEVSPAGPTSVRSIGPAGVREVSTIDRSSFGLGGGASLGAVAGGTPAENAAIGLAVLRGDPGPMRDFVLINAALALSIARDGVALPEAFAACAESVDSGKALLALRRLAEYQ